MKKDIYILGAGGFAKEVLYLLGEINKVSDVWSFKGFLDIRPDEGSTVVVGAQAYPVYNQDEILDSFHASEDVFFAIGIGSPKVLSKIYNRLRKEQAPNLIHPAANLDLDVSSIGWGNIVTAGCCFTVNISIGNFNIFNLNSTIGHDAKIGDCNVFNPGAHISGGVEIGSGCLIGTGGVVLQNVKCGDNVTVGAGAVVTKNCSSNATYVGVPAKELMR